MSAFWINEPLEQWIYYYKEVGINGNLKGKPLHKAPWVVCVGGGVAPIQARFTREGEARILVNRLKAAFSKDLIVPESICKKLEAERRARGA